MRKFIKNNHLRHVGVSLLLTCLIALSSFAQTTFDLSTVNPDASATPSGATFEWHSATPISSGNLIADVSAVGPGIYYAVYNFGSCYSQPTPYKILAPACPATTVDLTVVTDPADVPTGFVTTYHTGATPSDANKITSDAAKTAAIGAYYIAFYNTTSGCYSSASPVRVIKGACNSVIAKNDINDTQINKAVSGNVLTNDTDLEGNVMTVNTTPVTPPAHGSLVLNPDGTYTYTPTTGFTGKDTFVYSVCDNGTPQACDQATVTIDVIPALVTGNNPPVANDDTGVTKAGTPVNGNLISNDSDPDGDALTIKTTPITPPANGSIVINTDGTYTYTPNPGFTGKDKVVYEVCDPSGLCAQATLTITVLPASTTNITIANDDAGVGKMNQPIDGSLKANDSDPEGNTQTVKTTPVSGPTHGTVTIDMNGNFHYVPNNNYTGTDQFVYETCDNGTPQACDQATVYLTVLAPVNTVIAKNDINDTPANTAVSGNVLTNDTDPEGNVMTVNTTPITPPAHGSLVLNPDGTYTYTPTSGFTGKDTFVYSVCDNGTPQACDQATVTIDVIPALVTENNPPVANDDTGTTKVETPVSGNLVSNDGDPDGDVITINTTPVSPPSHGSITINTDGTYTYTPNPGFTGEDKVVYKICDPSGLCDQATLTIKVLPTLPVNSTFANDDAGIGKINQPIKGNLLANDFDPEGNMQSISTTPVSMPEHGTVMINSDGTYTYTPTTGYVGPDKFIYNVCDNGNPQACDQATVYLTVLAEPKTLPVTLTSFNVKSSSEGNKLTWSTADEKDFDKFLIEKTTNLKDNFSEIGAVSGGSNSYHFTDVTAAKGTTYYRLKMVDLDGSFTYSRIISAYTEYGADEHTIFPNPGIDHTIYIHNYFEISAPKLYNQNGQEVNVRVSKVDSRYKFSVDHNAVPGVYMLEYQANGQTIRRKFILK